MSKLLAGLAVAVVIALVPVAPALPQTGSLRVTQVSIKTFGDTTQLSVVGTGPLTYRTFQLSSPPRLVIDLPGATLDASVPPLIDVASGGVERVRVGQFQVTPAIVRVAVDMERAVPFTLATNGPAVVVAKFAVKRDVAKPATPTAPPAAPAAAPPVAAPPVQVAQASAPAPPAPAPAAAQAQAPAAQPVTPSRINLELRSTELADVLTAIAKLCNYNIVTDSSVKGQITVRLLDLSCDEALRYVLEANNLGFRRLGRNLIVMPAERLAPPPEVPEAVAYNIGFGQVDKIAEAVRTSVPGIRVAFDARTNTMVVVGTQAQHEQVQKVLASLDVRLVTVEVETRVVDVNTSDLKNLGLDWGLTGQPIFQIQGTFPGQVVIGVPTTGTDEVPNIYARLNALITQRKARIITAPRIAVLDGNEAVVNLGEDFPVPSIDTAGRLTFSFKPIGVILRVLPKVNRDGLITTKVEPEVSSVADLLSTPSGSVPRIATRKASTTITARNGESIVLAGLISAQERRTVLKVPLLGDIPILGALFRSTTTNREETEVIFIITPKIVPDRQ
ncbi:MAG: AMIN domain-containing protein [Armatimonadota bacterium]|nr:AMIN domain-containing protein [Armatimonadota bacterium]